MTDRNRELVPGSRGAWSEKGRCMTTGYSAEGRYATHSDICRRTKLPKRCVEVKKLWKVNGGWIIDNPKAEQRVFVLHSLLDRKPVKRVKHVCHVYLSKNGSCFCLTLISLFNKHSNTSQTDNGIPLSMQANASAVQHEEREPRLNAIKPQTSYFPCISDFHQSQCNKFLTQALLSLWLPALVTACNTVQSNTDKGNRRHRSSY